MDRSGTITVVVFTSPTEWYMSQYKTHVKMDYGGHDGATSISLATAAGNESGPTLHKMIDSRC